MIKKKPKLFAWDFHGTLEQGTEIGFAQILRDLARSIDYQVEIDLKEVKKLYGVSVLDYLRHFFPKLSNEELVKLRGKIKTRQHHEYIKKYIKSTPYAHEVLKQIKARGHKNIVISTSSKQHIRRFLRIVSMLPYFDAIFGIDRHALDLPFDIASEKAMAIKTYAKENDLSVKDIIVIGDRSGDIDAGRLVKAKTYQYINSSFPQIKTKADVKITDLRVILKEI